MLNWLFRRDPKTRIAKTAVRRVKKLLRGRTAPTLNIKVDYVFWYGAVEIDPQHCVVWKKRLASGRRLISFSLGLRSLPAGIFSPQRAQSFRREISFPLRALRALR